MVTNNSSCENTGLLPCNAYCWTHSRPNFNQSGSAKLTASFKLNYVNMSALLNFHKHVTYSMVKTAMISLWPSNHKLVRALIAYADRYSELLQSSWTHQSHQLEQERWLLVEQLGSFVPDGFFEFGRCGTGYCIPSLCVTPVHCKPQVC